MDCGSTGTRVHLFRTDANGKVSEFSPPSDEDAKLLEVEPGISSFAEHPEDAQAYMATLLAEAARWVPVAAQSQTRVHALATAGMRLLSAAVQAPVWAAIESALKASPFAYTSGDAYTISGNFEGLFNWLAIKYILSNAPPGLGGLDLGGASMQIAFAQPEGGSILEDAYFMTRNGTTAHVYSHSYMRMGTNEAHSRLVQMLANDEDAQAGALLPSLANPCLNPGYQTTQIVACPSEGDKLCTRQIHGTGDWQACNALTTRLMHHEYECLLPPCAAMGVYQPSAKGVQFYAVSAFFYTVNGLGLAPWKGEWRGSSRQIADTATSFCARPYSEIIAADKYAGGFCFNSAHIVSLLSVLGIGDESSSVAFSRKVDGFTVSWPLGAQLYFGAEQRCKIYSRLGTHSALTNGEVADLQGNLQASVAGQTPFTHFLPFAASIAIMAIALPLLIHRSMKHRHPFRSIV